MLWATIARGVYSGSSCLLANLSVENGVFNWSWSDFPSRCLDMRLSLARGLARLKIMRGFGDPRYKRERRPEWASARVRRFSSEPRVSLRSEL